MDEEKQNENLKFLKEHHKLLEDNMLTKREHVALKILCACITPGVSTDYPGANKISEAFKAADRFLQSSGGK